MTVNPWPSSVVVPPTPDANTGTPTEFRLDFPDAGPGPWPTLYRFRVFRLRQATIPVRMPPTRAPLVALDAGPPQNATYQGIVPYGDPAEVVTLQVNAGPITIYADAAMLGALASGDVRPWVSLLALPSNPPLPTVAPSGRAPVMLAQVVAPGFNVWVPAQQGGLG